MRLNLTGVPPTCSSLSLCSEGLPQSATIVSQHQPDKPAGAFYKDGSAEFGLQEVSADDVLGSAEGHSPVSSTPLRSSVPHFRLPSAVTVNGSTSRNRAALDC